MRIRTIKPSFFSNDEIAELTPLTRILFIGLWGLADVRGRLEDRPKRIKASILPYDDHDVEAALEDLRKAGFLTRYAAGDVRVIQIVNFEKHQRISGKEAEQDSEFPEFIEEIHGIQTGNKSGSNGEAPGKHPGAQEGKGREGNDNATHPQGARVSFEGPVDPPQGMPRTDEDAKRTAATVGCPEEVAAEEWHRANARGWVDARGIPIRNWSSYLRSCWAAAQSRKAEADARGSLTGLPRASTGSPRPPTVFEMTKVLEAKESLAAGIRGKHCSDVAGGTSWDSEAKREEWRKIRSEIKELKERIAKAV